MLYLDYKESWVLKNWCFWTVVLEKILESFLDCKEIKPVNPKGNQSWVFTGRSDTEAEAPILWPHDVKSWLTGKDSDAGKDWGQKEKQVAEDEMVGWHLLFNRHELGQTLGDGEGQRSLACCSPWGCEESDTTWWVSNNNNQTSTPVGERLILNQKWSNFWWASSRLLLLLLSRFSRVRLCVTP